MGLHSEASLHRAITQLACQLNQSLNKFPRHEKYGLCLEIRKCLYGMYGLMIEGQKRHHKKTALVALDIEHEKLRWYTNMAHELGYFASIHGDKNCKDGNRRYLSLSGRIDEVGRMIGGWIKSAVEKG